VAKRKPSTKRTLANIDNHKCVTRAEIIAELDSPTTKESRRIEEMAVECTKCRRLIEVLKANR